MEENSQLYLMLGRLEGKLDTLLGTTAALDKRVTGAEEHFDRLSARVDALEAHRDRASGAIVTVKTLWLVVAALAGMAMTYLKSFVTR